jgi:PST family polysaccharide transporter
MKALAKSGIIGSVVGFVTSVPLYFMFGKQGIVPSLIISAFSSVIFSNHFVRKVRYDKVKLSLREVISGSSSMVKMGIAIIFVSFMGTLFSLVVSAYIRHCGGLADVGLYQAGTAIVSGYFDIIISAMVTDYYPRICAVHKDNAKLQDALNKQSETGLIMLFPMVVIFAFFSSIILRILYSSEFIATNDYLDYAMLGTIIIFVSNSMDRILLAKQAAKVLLWTVIVLRIVFISIYLLLYKELNLFGLGLAYLATGVIHYAWMSAIMKRKYNIVLQRKNFCLLLLVLSVTMLAMFVRQIESFAIRYSIGITMIVVVSIFSVRYLDKNMNISIVGFVKSKFKRN